MLPKKQKHPAKAKQSRWCSVPGVAGDMFSSTGTSIKMLRQLLLGNSDPKKLEVMFTVCSCIEQKSDFTKLEML